MRHPLNPPLQVYQYIGEWVWFMPSLWTCSSHGDSLYGGVILIVYIASEAITANISRAREFIIGISGVRVANR